MTNQPAIISRSEAKAQSLKRYFTGKPCHKGHIALRNTASGECFECRLIPIELRVKARLTKLDDGTYSADKPCPNCGSMTRNSFGMCRICVNSRNKDRSKAYWREVTKGTEKAKEYAKRGYENNKPAYMQWSAQRRAIKKGQSLKNKPMIKLMREFYRNCPPGYHVDHVAPLVHPLICGVHCIANLQYLPAADNLSKHNKWPTCQKSMQPAWFDGKN